MKHTQHSRGDLSGRIEQLTPKFESTDDCNIPPDYRLIVEKVK